MRRVILIVMDSVGIGELPDAHLFGDVGSNTLRSVVRANPHIELPHLLRLGVGKIDGVDYLPKENAVGCYGRAAEVSKGKDTTTGHWEITGVHNLVPFLTYPNGFPEHVIREFERRTGRKTVCNRPASGTEIIEELGPHHMKTGELIVYTSADSVFQVAAHEEIVPLEELYDCCKIARELLVGDVSVARVIARPFTGVPGRFERTANRRDYSVKPPEKTLLDNIKESGLEVKAVGKISDIFDGEGITESVHTRSNVDGMEKTVLYMSQDFSGIIFTNLVDFDSKYGHRRNPIGYGSALEEFDRELPKVLNAMKEEDILVICADHGNDPCFHGTDHTREYIPILVYGKNLASDVNIGTRGSFSDIGATVAEYLAVPHHGRGESFLHRVVRDPARE
ncbi:MAG: phosphopentomutase [Bacillota bacterium]|nr:phosphopentomutase [Bacillota bacterium]